MPKKYKTCLNTSKLLLISPCIIDVTCTGTSNYRDSKTNAPNREPELIKCQLDVMWKSLSLDGKRTRNLTTRSVVLENERNSGKQLHTESSLQIL